MAILSDSEIAQLQSTILAAAQSNRKPQISEILASVQYAVLSAVDESGMVWYQDAECRELILRSIHKLMDENTPDMFNPVEKALMINLMALGQLAIMLEGV